MCIHPNSEFRLLNPTTQLALYSTCTENCSSIENITWNIYQGFMNSSLNVIQWIQFNQIASHLDIWFFGKNLYFIY
jgi:hypothetical protein